MKGVRCFVEVLGQCLRLREFIQSPINRINSEIHLEKKQKVFNKGKHEPLLRIIEHFLKGRHEPLMRIIEPPWKIT